MDKEKTISGFSKLSKRRKIKWLVENFFKDPENVMRELMSYWHKDEKKQKILDEISENTISIYPLPYGVSPNFVINGEPHCVPMVTEESSVVAAASSSSKFWMSRGGFHCEVIDTEKIGQVHFYWHGDEELLFNKESQLEKYLIDNVTDLTANMKKRGGGINSVRLKKFEEEKGYYQLFVSFETCDSMGANFINSILEKFAQLLPAWISQQDELQNEVEVLMSILSNYTPDCIVKASVRCRVADLIPEDEIKSEEFANRFYKAINTARIDPYRAATHNKGIFNGIDAVLIATANDFRAVESGGHAYASRDGQYRSLSHCEIKDGNFHFWLEIPLAIGTVGGLTNLHPIAKKSYELLGMPSAKELMQIIAATGLAQNFAAVKSLITTGIQKGHMKMHLGNILQSFDASQDESEKARVHFQNETVSHPAVRKFLYSLRNISDIV